MLRRFNYTGRKRIRHIDVPIQLCGSEAIRSFEADLTRVSSYSLPPESKVLVEAYEKTAFMRFDFGTVGGLTPPQSLELSEFEGSDAIYFRVKVVDTREKVGQLLAEADGILPKSEEERGLPTQPLLPVRSSDLGELVWKVEFPEGTQALPTLIVNTAVGDRTVFVRSAMFMSLALPAILREILTQILIVEDFNEMDDESDWKCLWLQFGKRLDPAGGPPPSEKEEASEWIEAVLQSFSSQHKLLSQLREAEEDESYGTPAAT